MDKQQVNQAGAQLTAAGKTVAGFLQHARRQLDLMPMQGEIREGLRKVLRDAERAAEDECLKHRKRLLDLLNPEAGGCWCAVSFKCPVHS